MNRQKRNRSSRRPQRGRRFPSAPLARFSNMQTYIFRISATQGFSSDGSGNLSGYIYNDPTSTLGNYAEHVSYLANLFTEMRVVRSRWHLVPQQPFTSTESKSTVNGALAVAVWTRNPSSLPSLTSLNQVMDNQPSKLWPVMSDTTGRGLQMKANFRRLNYQLVTTTSTDYAGCPGGLMFYGNAFPASTEIFIAHIEVYIQYRARS